jgi:hypothetical protein
MKRVRFSPHVCTESLEKRSWLKGMRISAVQPSESTCVAASHTGSHDLSLSAASPRQPAGFTSNSTECSRSR